MKILLNVDSGVYNKETPINYYAYILQFFKVFTILLVFFKYF